MLFTLSVRQIASICRGGGNLACRCGGPFVSRLVVSILSSALKPGSRRFMSIFASTWALLVAGLVFALPMLYLRVYNTTVDEVVL